MTTELFAPTARDASAHRRRHRRPGPRNLNPSVLPVLADGELCVLVSLSGAPATRDLGGARMLLRREHWGRLDEAEATCWTVGANGFGRFYVRSKARSAWRLANAARKQTVSLARLIAAWSGLSVPRGWVVRSKNGNALDLRPGNLEVVRNGVQMDGGELEPPPRLVVLQ